ncbi:MAG: excinuclease ABC subunit UvrC [Oscillospiraceae bacterium]|nr:excinuclease ABC subunit UvrC [Oscillospiraceae bacterium]
MSNPRVDILREKTYLLTTAPGVYRMRDEEGNIIYIGKAKNLRNRVSSYFAKTPDHTPKVAAMVENVYDYDFIVTNSEYEALVLECSMIKEHTPRYNILLKDDKGYSYICISPPPFSRITGELQKPESGEVLGPYTSSFVARKTADEVSRVFRLPSCKKVFPRDIRKGRPCLNYHIGRCMGVCTGKISEEEYAGIISEAVEYIKNGSSLSVERMTERMNKAAEELDFERAAMLRDRISAVTRAADDQHIFEEGLPDTDIIALARNSGETCAAVIMYRGGRLFDRAEYFLGAEGDEASTLEEFITGYYTGLREIPRNIVASPPTESPEELRRYIRERAGRAVDIITPQKGRYMRLWQIAKSNAEEYMSIRVGRTAKEIGALEDLAKLLSLDKPPLYIESYDISNLGSVDMVAGMIVFENGRPSKKNYKRFSIKENLIQNDVECMKEVLTRRFSHYLDPEETDEGFRTLPDLILLDGGQTQLNGVLQVMDRLGIDIPVFGMVKDGRHRTRAITSKGGEISISGSHSAFMLVTRIQDEVHRYSVTYQRNRHRKNSVASGFTSIRGIGDKKAAKLMDEFKTIERLKEATAEEIAAAIKVPAAVAEDICEYVQHYE